MSPNNSFVAPHEPMTDHLIEHEANAQDVPHDSSREGTIAALMQAHANSGIETPRYEPCATPLELSVASLPTDLDTATTTAPITPVLNPDAAAFIPATPEHASLVVEPEVVAKANPFISSVSRHASWADEKEEELEHMAAAEAEGKAKVDAWNEDEGSWATVKKSKQRPKRSKNVVVDEVASLKAAETTEHTQSARDKEDIAVPGTTAVCIETLPIDEPKQDIVHTEATGVSDDTTDDYGDPQELGSPAEKTQVVSTTPPVEAEVESETLSAASLELAADDSKPASPAVADSWDDYIETMPTIQMHNFQVAHDREFDAEEEAQARFAAGLSPLDDGTVTAADLQRIHEEAEMVRKSAKPPSPSAAEYVADAAQDAEDLHKSEVAADEVERPAVPFTTPVNEPTIAVATEAEYLPVLVSEVEKVPAKVLKQVSILDFLKKVPVVTAEGVFPASPSERVRSQSAPTEAMFINIAEPQVASESVEDLQGASSAVDSKPRLTSIPPVVDVKESEPSPDTTQVDIIEFCNVADNLDYLTETDHEDASENAENLQAPSATIKSSFEGVQDAPKVAITASSTHQFEAQEDAGGANSVGERAAVSLGGDEGTSHAPIVARQKKKRSKAERNAAKKRTAASGPLSTVVEEKDISTGANVAITACTRRVHRREKRKVSKSSPQVATSRNDVEHIDVPVALDVSAKVAKQDREKSNKRKKSIMVTFLNDVTAVFRKGNDGKDKGEVELSVQDTVEAYSTMVEHAKKGTNAQKKTKLPRALQQRRAWKPIDPIAPPGVREALAARRAPGVAARLKARLSGLAAGMHIGGVTYPWLTVFIVVLTVLSALHPILQGIQVIWG